MYVVNLALLNRKTKCNLTHAWFPDFVFAWISQTTEIG